MSKQKRSERKIYATCDIEKVYETVDQIKLFKLLEASAKTQLET